MNELPLSSPRWRERGFSLSIRTEEEEKNEVRLVHSDGPQFYIRIWIPTDSSDTAPTGFVETKLPVSGHLLRLGVDCQSIIDNCSPLGEEGSSVALDVVQKACTEGQFEQFMVEVLRPFRWKKLLTRIVKPKEIMPIVNFIRSNLLQWKHRAEERIYISPTREIPYPIEFNRVTGSIWIYYTFNNRETTEIQLFALNLENIQKEELYQWVEYDVEIGRKIESFGSLFDNNFGLIQFHEFFRNERHYIGKHVAYDYDLTNFMYELTLNQKWAISCQLLQGLAILEREGIVHCGIFPKAIYFRFEQQEQGRLVAVISDFRAAYLRAQLPDSRIRSIKWAKSIPPECAETSLLNHPRPSAIPIFQLGWCLKLILKGEETEEIQAILNTMLNPDPERRGTANGILQAWLASEPEKNSTDRSV